LQKGNKKPMNLINEGLKKGTRLWPGQADREKMTGFRYATEPPQYFWDNDVWEN
jgi:hypothetical protein